MASDDEKTPPKLTDFMIPENLKETTEGGLPIRDLFGVCEMERFGSGAPCKRPAVAVWVCDAQRTLVCRECSWTISVCGGAFDDLPPNV
jgi:hypothetical protein